MVVVRFNEHVRVSTCMREVSVTHGPLFASLQIVSVKVGHECRIHTELALEVVEICIELCEIFCVHKDDH